MYIKRLKVKSSDLSSDLVRGRDSKPYSNTGILLENTSCSITSLGCNATDFTKNSIY